MIKTISHIITAYVLTIILLAHNINTLVIVSDFVMNQDFIAKTLCIQKDDQQGCNGKCQLKTELAKNETGTEGNSPIQNIVKRHSLDVFFVSDVNRILEQPLSGDRSTISIYSYTPKLHRQVLFVETPPPDLS
ncbi:hypothetical protein BZARG_1496 [Bizionia argentinensis JUB59]|uniref:Uncharacterized protein n=1 Tax=Bizionia argentinensis JUB59 TaxID=1046627 RepID=G2EC72_9FLAO|nr:hypothetical protein [Bizionia argentinensis]EGV43959.1 hypothetical protein BZARG_1496 [Bizionia argentinensis JUB59]